MGPAVPRAGDAFCGNHRVARRPTTTIWNAGRAQRSGEGRRFLLLERTGEQDLREYVRTVRMQERGVPMDPDRDERQAWLSVSEKTSETEGYLFHVAAFYNSFLGECRIDQREDGCVSDAGSYWPWAYTGDPCWPAVVTTTPWSCYRMYGDRRILAENYPMMKRWVEFLETRLDPDFIYRKGTYSDWVDAYSMDQQVSDFGATSRDLLSTAYMYYNCDLVAKTAAFLGKPDDAAHFRATAEQVGAAFNRTFFDPQSNTYASKTQTSYVLPLAFGLVPSEHRQAVADNLVQDILVEHTGHLSVGCVGMKWLMQTLTEIGRTRRRVYHSHSDHATELGLYGEQGRHLDLGALGPRHARPRHEWTEPDDPGGLPGGLDVSDPRRYPLRSGATGFQTYDLAAPARRRSDFRRRIV